MLKREVLSVTRQFQGVARHGVPRKGKEILRSRHWLRGFPIGTLADDSGTLYTIQNLRPL